MERITGLNEPIQINQFSARGQIEINESLLSYDIQNGIASIRFINRKDNNKTIIEALSDKWYFFEDYIDKELPNNEDQSALLNGFHAYLRWGYFHNNAICFYVQMVVQEAIKTDIHILDIFSPCLVNHFESVENFDFNSCGYVEDNPSAICSVDGGVIKIYRTVAVQYNRHKVSYKYSFPKNFVGGFRFEYNKPFTNNLIKRCIDAVNEYCCFLLVDAGYFISQVELVEPQVDVNSYICYLPKNKNVETEILFSFSDISSAFQNLISEFFELTVKFSSLYLSETNIYHPIDTLRIASMFENQYRKNTELLQDYEDFEQEYKSAYLKVITLNETYNEKDPIEQAIAYGEKERRQHPVMSSLKMQLNFIFEKLMKIIGSDQEKAKTSFLAKLNNYNVCKLATRIKDARNDMAHFLESEIDYAIVSKDTYILQLMIYCMIFERIGLSNNIIKEIILHRSRTIKDYFGI